MTPSEIVEAVRALVAIGVSPDEAAATVRASLAPPVLASPEPTASEDPEERRKRLARERQKRRRHAESVTERDGERDAEGSEATPSSLGGSPEYPAKTRENVVPDGGTRPATRAPSSLSPVAGSLGEEKEKIPALPRRSARGASRTTRDNGPSLFASEDVAPTSDPIAEVWEAYVAARAGVKGNAAPPKLDASRRDLIRRRLEEHGRDLVLAAVRGIWRSDYHVVNGYTSIELAIRSAEKIERFAAAFSESRSDNPGAWTEAEKASWRKSMAGKTPRPLDFPLERPVSPEVAARPVKFNGYMRKIAAQGGYDVDALEREVGDRMRAKVEAERVDPYRCVLDRGATPDLCPCPDCVAATARDAQASAGGSSS